MNVFMYVINQIPGRYKFGGIQVYMKIANIICWLLDNNKIDSISII